MQLVTCSSSRGKNGTKKSIRCDSITAEFGKPPENIVTKNL